MDKKKFQQNLGKHIAKLRTWRRMSVTELSDMCGKDRQSIERLEKGEINPSAYYLHQIANGLEVPVSRLLEF